MKLSLFRLCLKLMIVMYCIFIWIYFDVVIFD